MIYIQFSEEYALEGFYLLMRDGTERGSIKCLPQNTYEVNEKHVELLKNRGIPFKKVNPENLKMPVPDAYK